MQPSMFNVRVPLPERNEVFLMNTMADSQLIVSDDVASLLDRLGGPSPPAVTDEERSALETLAANGFIVPDRGTERAALDRFFRDTREDTSQLRVTVLTTLQCNFACDYCIQGDHGDYNKHARKMSPETADRVLAWVERRLDEIRPQTFVITFFGGEPLLNLPVLYSLSERLWAATQARGVDMLINIITNGLLLGEDVVDRLLPFGLNGVKVTLDGDHDTHDRMRPLRGGQGTFDRIIGNVRRIAHKCKVAIGGNFDASSADTYPALLDFLKEQEFADHIAKVAFKPIIQPLAPASPAGVIPLTAVGSNDKPLNGACMTGAGSGAASPCDTCHFVDDTMSFLREETRKRGFPTLDGVHMGPCEIHKRHAYTIGPEGSLYACPGFSSEDQLSIGHVDERLDAVHRRATERFDRLAPWKECGDCSFIPVCGGGCSVAAYSELGSENTPSCHKPSMETALVSLARETAAAARLDASA